MGPGVQHWVVERSNIASLPSKRQLEQLLELHAFLVQPGAGAELAPGGAGAPVPRAPEPAGPGAATAGAAVGAAGTSAEAKAGDVFELIRRFVEDAYDGVGRWNFVEEVRTQQLGVGPAGALSKLALACACLLVLANLAFWPGAVMQHG
jgi:hypothetical protein